jgi:hypothetical protein
MTITFTKLNESYIKAICDDLGILKSLSDSFSFMAENYRWNKKYKSKQFGDIYAK